MNTIGQKYNDGLDELNRFTSLLASNKERTVRMVTNIILVLLIMGVFGCFDFINWQFDFSRFLSTEYWSHLMTRVVSGIASFNIGINLNWENAVERAVELKKNIELYELLIKQKDDSNFGYFVNHIFNVKLKRRAYINSINRKIHRLDRHSKDSDRKLYDTIIPQSSENYEQEVKELEEKKSTNKYCIRRTELEYLKSDEYIQRNLESIGVKYPRVKPSSFNVGIDSKIREDEFRTEGNVNLGKIKASTGVAISMVFVSLVFSLISYSINQEQFETQMAAFLNFLINFLMDVIIVIWRMFSGTRNAPKIVNEQLTLPYANRNTVMKEYIDWRDGNEILPSKSFSRIKELTQGTNDEIEIEMSKEEVEKYLKGE